MAIDLDSIRETIILSIKHSIGDDLAQGINDDTGLDEGIVLLSRQDLPESMYPYAILDLLLIDDTDWHLTSRGFNEDSDYEYNTHKTLQFQITVYGNHELGGEAIQIINKLESSYRREDMLDILKAGLVSLAKIEQVMIMPELLQTDYLEVSAIKLSVRVNDKYVDPDLESIEDVKIQGELTCNLDDDPIEINIDTTT